MFEYLTNKILDISSLSLADTAKIHASIEYMYNDKFQCNSKEAQLFKRYMNDPQAERKVKHLMESHRNLSFCNRKSDSPVHYVSDFGYNSCLCQFLHPLISYYLLICESFERGVMPHEGSLSEQSAMLIDVIYLIQNLKNEHMEKVRKEASKNTKG